MGPKKNPQNSRQSFLQMSLGFATPECLLQRPKTSKMAPKWLGEGAKGVFGDLEKCSPMSPLAPVATGLLVHMHQNTFCTPLLTTLANFKVSGPCSTRGHKPEKNHTTIPPQMMTCLFNCSGLRSVNYPTLTFTFFILADGALELQLPLSEKYVICLF